MLSKEQAIKECKELWEEIAKSGLCKDDFFRSPLSVKWRGKYLADCPLCQYAYEQLKEVFWRCPSCPLVEKYGGAADPVDDRCEELGYDRVNIDDNGFLEYIRNL